MPAKPNARWGVPLLIAALLLTLPAAAQATLAFVRNPLKPSVYVAADDGSAQRRLDSGSNPHVSPDGQLVAYMSQGSGRSYRPSLMVVSADGGTPRRLLQGWREPGTFAWSPDSSEIAVVKGPEIGPKSLVLIDLASGIQSIVATGFFSGVSFDPEGGRIVYGRATREAFPDAVDVFRFEIPQGQALRYLPPDPLTHDQRSLSPLWGPNGRIVFVKQLGAKQRKYGPKNELFLMNPSGKGVRQLTHTKVDPLLFGLYPTQWSANGKRLLAEFEGQDTSYAVTVNLRNGSQRPLTREREQGFVGTALSSDGSTVLGWLGGFEPGPGHKVVTIPSAGGKPKTLAKNAFEPDRSR